MWLYLHRYNIQSGSYMAAVNLEFSKYCRHLLVLPSIAPYCNLDIYSIFSRSVRELKTIIHSRDKWFSYVTQLTFSFFSYGSGKRKMCLRDDRRRACCQSERSQEISERIAKNVKCSAVILIIKGSQTLEDLFFIMQ